MAIVDKFLDALFKALEGLAVRAEADQNRALGGQALLRAAYIEAANNLDLLDCLDKAALKEAPVAGPAFAAIAARLESPVARAVLTDAEEARPGGLYQVLQGASGGAEERPGAVYGHVLQSFPYVVKQISLLQKLATLTPEESSLLHRINLSTRVDHLKKRLVDIKTTLQGLSGIYGIPGEG